MKPTKKGRFQKKFVEENSPFSPRIFMKSKTEDAAASSVVFYSPRSLNSLRYIMSPASQEEKKSIRISWIASDQ